MPWCPRCATGISQHEIVTDGYAELTHRSVILRFPLRGREKESLLVWTTTPWTLAANVAVAVNPDMTYALLTDGTSRYYVGAERADIVATMLLKGFLNLQILQWQEKNVPERLICPGVKNRLKNG